MASFANNLLANMKPEKSLIGTYKLKEDGRFRCGLTSFGMSAGATVQVTQVDTERNKVLVVFGERLLDWFDESILGRFDAV